MQLESVTAEIRPRSDWEAADLGFAMVRRDFWRCFSVWWLVMALPGAPVALILWDHPALFFLLFWWGKPAGSRLVLFELSRRLFGEKPPWRAVWRELPRAWTRRFFHRFLWARFSPWLPVTLAVEDLEGLRGSAYRQRCVQLGRRGGGVVTCLYFVADLAAGWAALGLIGTVLMLMPSADDNFWTASLQTWDPQTPLVFPLLVTRVVVACLMLAVSLTDILVTGAGFGIYINNRTWIEGWDVELAFKRMAKRLANVALLTIALLMLTGSARAAESMTPEETIQEVKADPDFIVHSVTHRVPVESSSPPRTISPPTFIQELSQIAAICGVALLIGFLGLAVWKNRHIFLIRGGGGGEGKRLPPGARVVMGMEISRDSLPADIPTRALELWRADRHQEALALLYRGAISRAIETARVEILESDTEGDCLRRVEAAGAAAHPAYFRGLTGVWARLAYAGVAPGDEEVGALCQTWPFGRGGGA